MRTFLICGVMLLCSTLAQSQDVTGIWHTIDDETGQPRAVVRLWVEEGVLKGKIVKPLGPDADPEAVCGKCPEKGRFAYQGEPITGLTFIDGLKRNGQGAWEGDDAILDPKTGRIFDAKIWLDENQPDRLKVRGYIGFFYRTQTWKRAT